MLAIEDGLGVFWFMLSPQETYEEATSYRLNYEPVPQSLPPGLTNDDLNDLYHAAQGGRPEGLARLERMVKRYPVVPTLWNYLAVAYRIAGKEKKAREVERKMLERHPDYLFAKIAEASRRIESGRGASLPELLGKSMSLQEALGHDRAAHLSEWKFFYATVAEWHMEAGRLEHAEMLLKAIRRERHTEEVTESLERGLMLARMRGFQQRLLADSQRRVEVKQGRLPVVRERKP
ncbi:MAG: hypothetical protein MUF31_09670 [Akkermansiaceae bacterium]|jgi:tetratricopeptide (TPR) repeat protein|nr:hypothetical protein [Akkermansiaceae bacterium]